jgi:hypothetical protein
MEAARSSETSVNFYWITRRYFPSPLEEYQIPLIFVRGICAVRSCVFMMKHVVKECFRISGKFVETVRSRNFSVTFAGGGG